MTGPGLSDDMHRRLDALRERGCEVDGPTVAEDTSPSNHAAEDGRRDRRWHVVLRCPGPDGATFSAEGDGMSPDEAARAALAELSRTAPALSVE